MENFDDTIGANFLAVQEAKAQEAEWLNDEQGGAWLARLIANQPTIVSSFTDHALVAHKLLAAGEIATLHSVAASGRLTGLNLRFYRMALCLAVTQGRCTK